MEYCEGFRRMNQPDDELALGISSEEEEELYKDWLKYEEAKKKAKKQKKKTKQRKTIESYFGK
jgi:hypothetical protein